MIIIPSQFFFSSTKIWIKGPQIGSDMPSALGLVDIARDKKLKWSWILGRMNVFVTLKPRHERLIICIVPLLSFSLSFQFCLIRLVQPRSQTWDLLVCINLIKCVCDCYTFPAAESESMFVSLGPRHETLMSTSKATSACFALSEVSIKPAAD